jgi:8-oxo-dGTP diphosphatase
MEVVGGILLRDGRVLLGHRQPERAWYPDCWDVPGGHVQAGESKAHALRRELTEELGVTLVAVPPAVPHHVIEAPDYRLSLYVVRDWIGEPANTAPDEHDRIAWFSMAEVGAIALADRRLLGALAAALADLLDTETYPDASGEVSLALAGSQDAEWLLSIHEAAFRELVDREFGGWDPATQRRLFAERDPGSVAEIIRLGGELVGFVYWRPDELGSLSIELLAVPSDVAGPGRGHGGAAHHPSPRRRRSPRPTRPACPLEGPAPQSGSAAV